MQGINLNGTCSVSRMSCWQTEECPELALELQVGDHCQELSIAFDAGANLRTPKWIPSTCTTEETQQLSVTTIHNCALSVREKTHFKLCFLTFLQAGISKSCYHHTTFHLLISLCIARPENPLFQVLFSKQFWECQRVLYFVQFIHSSTKSCNVLHGLWRWQVWPLLNHIFHSTINPIGHLKPWILGPLGVKQRHCH